MNPDDETADPTAEPTVPLRSSGEAPSPAGGSWMPPVAQPRPGQAAGWGTPGAAATYPPQPFHAHGQPPSSASGAPTGPAPYGPPPYAQGPYGLAPYGEPQRPAPKGRVPGWLWPVVAVLALVVGLFGGAVGAVVVDQLRDDTPGLVDGGLDDVDTVSDPPLPADNGSVAAVARELLPSTVQIVAEFEGDQGGATGSGFVLDRQGHVVTNNHVVEEADRTNGSIEVVDQAGDRHEATVVGRSPVYDLAVLFVKDAPRLRPAALGASESLRVGEGVVAIGSPLGLSSTVTAGIVSALDRPVTTGSTSKDSSYINAVQTDAAINPGNSGGPLVDLQGRVVGVNSAIATTGGVFGGESGNIGVGFAIPVEQVRITADQILKTGEARYPVIGASVEVGRGDGNGALVQKVMEGTPAQDAGLRAKDVITAVEGERVTDGIALIVAIRTHQPGETIEFTVVRDGDERTVEVTLDSEVG